MGWVAILAEWNAAIQHVFLLELFLDNIFSQCVENLLTFFEFCPRVKRDATFCNGIMFINGMRIYGLHIHNDVFRYNSKKTCVHSKMKPQSISLPLREKWRLINERTTMSLLILLFEKTLTIWEKLWPPHRQAIKNRQYCPQTVVMSDWIFRSCLMMRLFDSISKSSLW